MNAFTPLAYDTEYTFLLGCVRAALNGANPEVRVAVDTHSLNWQRFSEIAYHHRVVPLAAAGLGKLGVDTVPEDVENELNDYVAGYTLRSQFLANELIRLLALLDAHGISSLPYKGPALAASLYDDISLRPSGDLDILVDSDNVIKTQKLLEANGYNLWGFPRGWQWRSYHFSFVRQDRNVLFQLHWRFQPPGFPFHLAVRDVFTRSQTTELLGHTVPTLSAEDLLIVLSVHAAKHLFDRLIWLCDLARLITVTKIDWEQVVDRVRKAGVLRMVLVAVSILQPFFNVYVPEINALLQKDETALAAVSYHASRCLSSPRAKMPKRTQASLYRHLRERKVDEVKLSMALKLGVVS